MFAVLTVCHTRQLPQAITLGKSVQQVTPEATFLIGLADELPDGVTPETLPFAIIPASAIVSGPELTSLSAVYTPTEMAGALKPLFLKTCYERLPDCDTFIYADPNICFYQPLSAIKEQLTNACFLLTPYLVNAPADGRFPDEKHLQNIGLYNSDFLALHRSDEVTRFLDWWDSRVRTRAHINFCEGLCTDQIWLMHVPAFFNGVRIVQQPAWHVGVWNLHNRQLRNEAGIWHVDEHGPLVIANLKGLTNPDDGFFPYQNRISIRKRPDIQQLIATYSQQLQVNKQPALTSRPVYGQLPEPVILRGWRKGTIDTLRKITTFIDIMPIPVIR